MPKVDGLTVMERVGKDCTIKKHPAFIVVSAVGQEQITEDAFNLGANYYVLKPFDNDMLISRIKHIRQLRDGRKDLRRIKKKCYNGGKVAGKGARDDTSEKSGEGCYGHDP